MTPLAAARARLRRLAWAVRALPSTTPLRVKLVSALLVLVTLALSMMGLVGTAALRHYLLDQVNGQLVSLARSFGEGRGPGPGRFIPPNTSYYVLYTDPNGVAVGDAQLYVPNGLNQDPPALPAINSATATRLANSPFTAATQGAGHDWRILVSTGPTGYSQTVGISLDEVDNIVGRLVYIDVVVSLTVLVAFGALGYGMVRSSLRGLVTVETTAKAIAAGDLSRRVPELSERTEVGRLAAALNSMLAQIEAAFSAQRRSEAEARGTTERMRQFLADASHELRTPLTSVRGFAELHRQGGVPEDGVPRMMRRIEDESTRMGGLVEDMLLLARLDQQRPLERRPVDLLAIAADAVQDAPAMSADHPARLDLSGTAGTTGPPPVVLGDEARLRQVVANLMTNAVQHTPPGTAVTVGLRTEGDPAQGGVVELSVADDGPGLTAEDAARVFERFYRVDPARTRQHGGAGLGLSIVAALVAAHGGTVRVHTLPGQGATFLIRLPLSPETADRKAASQLPAGTQGRPSPAVDPQDHDHQHPAGRS